MEQFLTVVKTKNNVVDYVHLLHGPNGILQKGSNCGRNIKVVAEEEFVSICKEMGFSGTDDEMEDILSDGYYEADNETVCLCWPEMVSG